MVPPYAILSHRWGGEEVSLQEWHRVEALEDKIFGITRQPAFGRPRHPNDYLHDSLQNKWGRFATEKGMITSKLGYSKILSCCKLVREETIHVETQNQRCRYVWIDTCCIDKTNNAELSEAINSMFRWYEKSLVCLAHLADVHTNLGQKEMEDEFRNSAWFQRGWTLQELLAPPVIKFFDQEWEYLFDREHQARLISNITRIDEDILTGSKILSKACSAEKMSWAASRTTSRKEDIAYCLLGIFDVNMPLLYGEGDKAFVRLQEEIIRQSGDLSIFAWGYNVPMVYETCGIFAHSPVDFIGCSNLRRRHNRLAVMSMMNVTLSVQLRYYKPRSAALDFIYADLDCSADLGWSIFLPLVIEKPEGAYNDKKSTARPFDVTAIRFERRGGSRPIVLSEVQGFYIGWIVDNLWVPEFGTISILKKDSEYTFVRQIYLGGLKLKDPASQSIIVEAFSQGAMDRMRLQVVLDEVYPPHCSGKTASILHMEEICRQSFEYPGSAEGTSEHHHREYGNVSYLRISCWNGNSKRSEMVVMVRRSETSDSGSETSDPGSSDSEPTMEVGLSEWPHYDCKSLADCAFRGHTLDRYKGVTPVLGPGVESKEFGDFIVEHTSDSIYFFARGEANVKPEKVTEASEGRSEEGMVGEAEDVEEVGSDWSENSGDLGVHGLFDHSRTTVPGSPSRNDTEISQTNASDYDARDTENESDGNQVNEEGDGKLEEESDNLGIMGLFQ